MKDFELAVQQNSFELLIEQNDYDLDIGENVQFTRIIPAGGLPLGGNVGDIIIKTSSADYAAEWVPPASHAEADNTRPITAAAVYTEIGNINALLATI